MEAGFAEVVRLVSRGIEAGGIAAIVLGILWALARFGVALMRATRGSAYRGLRADMGRSILLGLEMLVAADIINTVAVEPTLRSVGVLAAIVAIRTFLSFTLELEIDGRWPWQAPGDGKSGLGDRA